MEYRTKQELIYEELLDGIMTGRYKPGERLDIEAIAQRVGASRTPIREAIRRLESEGLVTSVPHRGTLVAQLSVQEVAELYHIRAVLEGLAARLAAQSLTRHEADLLRDVCGRMSQEEVASDDEAFLRMNREFHEVINEAAKAPLLHEYIINLYVTTSRYRRLTATFPGRMQGILDEHQALADAILTGDAIEAERLANMHHENNALALKRLAGSIEEMENAAPRA